MLSYPSGLVCECVKCWLADLAVLGLVFAAGKNLFKRIWGSITHSLLLSPAHRPSMTEILLKRKKNCESSSHPPIPFAL